MSGWGSHHLRSAEDLIAAELAGPAERGRIEAVAARYAVRVTPEIAALIGETGLDGPIARQFLPDPRELIVAPEERVDPIGDEAHRPVKGVVHRYPDRALLQPVLVCPVYCRFCFRRETVGPDGGALTQEETDEALGYIAATPAIREVILTGGDPLMLSPRRLAALLGRIAALPSIELIRIHSRVPVADPARITSEMVSALRPEGAPVYVAIHCNRAEELGAAARAAAARLADAGIPLLAQTVLLKGVNDDAETLAELFRALVRNRIRPYYLHHPDLAPGTAHFRLGIEEGRALMRALRGRVSGLALPTYVLDIPGGFGKVPVGPDYLDGDRVSDPFGGAHAYPERNRGTPPALLGEGQADRVRRPLSPSTPDIRR